MQETKIIEKAVLAMLLCLGQQLFMVIKEATNFHLLSTEAEFVVATACACQAIWLRRILGDL